MGFEPEKEANTELNLSMFSLPIKPQEPPAGALTPPLRTTASIPFQWEEAPGKPRHCNTESKPQTSRTLELPPRLLTESNTNTNNNNNNNLCSPTTVLDGPEIGRSLFVSYSFRSPDNLGKRISSENRAGFFRGSSRWGSFRKKKEVVEAATTFDIFSSYLVRQKQKQTELSSSIAFDFLKDNSGGGSGEEKVKIARVRRSSYMNLSQTKSPLLVSIYESFKQVVPWRRRQEKVRKNGS